MEVKFPNEFKWKATFYGRETVTSTIWIHHQHIIFAEVYPTLSDLKQSFTTKRSKVEEKAWRQFLNNKKDFKNSLISQLVDGK